MPKRNIEQEIAEKTGAVLLGNFPSGSREWLDLRKTGIGGSEVAAICGFSKWTSPYTLWCQKTNRISGEIPMNDAMEWGTRLEPVIIDKFSDNHPELTVHRDVGTWHHPDRRFRLPIQMESLKPKTVNLESWKSRLLCTKMTGAKEFHATTNLRFSGTCKPSA